VAAGAAAVSVTLAASAAGLLLLVVGLVGWRWRQWPPQRLLTTAEREAALERVQGWLLQATPMVQPRSPNGKGIE
jgi:hypothetical protein